MLLEGFILSSEMRIRRLKDKLAEMGVDAILIANERNIYYLTEFAWGFRLLVPVDGDNILFVHSVNYEAAKNIAKNVTVNLVKVGEKAETKVIDEISRSRFKNIGFDILSAAEYLKMKDALKETRIEPLEDILWSLRRVKDVDEISLIKRAAEITSRGVKRALEVIRPGLKGYEVAAEAEYEMRKMGSSGTAFNTIVCSGPETAYPHGGLGEHKIANGDLVVIDVGARYHGYCADMTRTVIVGEASWRQKHIREIVREAQRIAISHLKNGVKARDIDEAVRRFITERGYGEYFVHGVGHGVGLDVHEPPILGPTSEDTLCVGNVVTIEPGIYIPTLGGARIEDTFLIIENGALRLTSADDEC